MSGVGIHWFRFGLRLHDNPALLQAVKCSSSLLNVYILDPEVDLNPKKIGNNRLWFLLETLRVLDSDLQVKGSRLFVCLGQPTKVLPALAKAHKAKFLTFEKQTEPHYNKRDKVITESLQKLDVQVQALVGHTLFDPEVMLKLNNGSAPLSMTSFVKLSSKAGPPPKPQDSPASIPASPSKIGAENVHVFDGIPTLKDFEKYGYSGKVSATFKAGEDQALKAMAEFLKQEKRVAKFEKPQTNPTSLEPDTTALSPYMSNGSLSCRRFYWQLMQVYGKNKAHSKPPVSLEGQLLWREMAHLIGYSVPNFDRMEGNPVCRQIPWKTGQEAQEMLDKWEQGKTGFPAVDAVMNQLRTEGWMHHLARHLTACFLTRGDLWISWELGRDVFERHLLDADWSINNFSWHWLSCSAFFHQFFRCYSPIAFFKKTDPSGSYIRKHVPELKKMPEKYIYEPWLAPQATQQAAGCIIGKDYPNPPFDHSKVSKENMNKMKRAFDENKKTENGAPKPKKAKQN